MQGFIGALPDLDAVEQEMVAEGNPVWGRYVINATHQADPLGIPATGRKVQWTAVDGVEGFKDRSRTTSPLRLEVVAAGGPSATAVRRQAPPARFLLQPDRTSTT